MAKRYSGQLVINVLYNLHGSYDCHVSIQGKNLCHIVVNPPACGYGKGVSYDSPEAYDSVAASAVAFSLIEVKADVRSVIENAAEILTNGAIKIERKRNND
jgi:hypothetical protein